MLPLHKLFFFVLALILNFSLSGFCQEAIFKVVDKEGIGVAYTTIFINERYALLADESGKFTLPKLLDKDTLVFSAMGYKKLTLPYKRVKSIVVLENSPISLSEIRIYPKKTLWLGYTGQEETIHNTNLAASMLFEKGILIFNNQNLQGFLSSVRVKVGFIGKPKLPYRINIYSIGKNGLPHNNLMNDEIIFIPKSKKLRWYEFDISTQQIEMPKEGICIGIEVLNPSTGNYTFTSKFAPVRLDFFSHDYPGVMRTNTSDGWVLSNSGTLGASIKLEIL